MPLVSENLGNQDADTTSVFLRQMAVLLTQIINDTKNQSGYLLDSMQGAKVLNQHLQKGGKVLFHPIPADDSVLFETLLRSQRIPFVKVAEENNKAYYATRDIDRKKVSHVFELYVDEIKKGFREFTPAEFIQDNAGKNIFRAKNYTEAELMVFRKEAAELGFSYAVAGNENHPEHFDILYSERDVEFAGTALKGLEYEFSGMEGVHYRMMLEQSIQVKDEILSEAKRNPEQMQYIVSQNDPMHFATIKEGVLTEHSLSLKEKKDRIGETYFFVEDNIRKTQPFGNKELTNVLKKLGTGFLTPEADMTFVKDFDKSGRAIVTDEKEMAEVLTELKNQSKTGRYPLYQPYLDRYSNRTGKEVTKEERKQYEAQKKQYLNSTYDELPQEQQKLLDRIRSHEVTAVHSDTKEQTKVVEQEHTRRYQERSFR